MQKAKQVALQVSPWSLYVEERDLPTHVRSDLFQQLHCVAWEVWEVVNFLIVRFISKRLISVTLSSYIYCAKNRTRYSVASYFTELSFITTPLTEDIPLSLINFNITYSRSDTNILLWNNKPCFYSATCFDLVVSVTCHHNYRWYNTQLNCYVLYTPDDDLITSKHVALL